MPDTRAKLSLVEYASPVDLSRLVAGNSTIDIRKAQSLLLEAGKRAAITLGFTKNPIRIEARGVTVANLAGLLRLSPSLELEIAPKFLGLDVSNALWREDFFFLSTLSIHGHLLATEQLAASGSASRDLPTLVARSMTGMYEARKRRPLRSYHKVEECGFYIDGEPDPVDLIFPSADGFVQQVSRLDQTNQWNADILAAACRLLAEVREPAVTGALVRLIEGLSPQRAPAGRRRPIPARHRAWQPLHGLAVDVLDGMGLNYRGGHAAAPGYLVATWRVWEDLLAIALRIGFGRAVVLTQQGYYLGTRTKAAGSISSLRVYPDYIIEPDGDRPRMLLDAKYKTNLEKGRPRISEADIYESLAFSRATGCTLIILLYPALPDVTVQPVGHCAVFETVRVDTVQILGVQVEVRGISKSGALNRLAINLAKWISTAWGGLISASA